VARSEGQIQSQKHEKRLEKALGGKRTAASGAFWSRKGDVRTNDLLIEHKWTGKKSFSVKSDVLEKIVTEAILDGRTPVLGVHLNGEDYVLLTEYDFIELRNYRIEHECDTTTTPSGLGDTTPNAEG
jgi:Holliday junction resolvase